MSILKYNDLLKFDSSYRLNETYDLNKSITANISNKVFLSHRHDDKEWVLRIVRYLKSEGVDVYIDSKDHFAPRVTSPETASLIKNRIVECKKFIVLASPGSIDSKWIPWELGYADKAKGINRVAVLPIGTSDSDWSEREYFGLYNVGLISNAGTLCIFKPGATTGGVALKDWVES